MTAPSQTVREVCAALDALAPVCLSEDWDNVGLLLGDPAGAVRRIMTCLTITPATADEAVDRRADLIVTHHPLPFRPLKRITTDTIPGRLVWRLATAGVAVYSPHTAWDSAADGINQRLAAGIGLDGITPLTVHGDLTELGTGRCGTPTSPMAVRDLAAKVKEFLGLSGLHLVGNPSSPVRRVAVACGSAGSLLPQAIAAGCDAFVTGETGFHNCLEAEANGVALVLTGHYASERFGVEHLAGMLADRFRTTEVWASIHERDPLAWV